MSELAKAVFLSYAREDAEAVTRRLETAAGLPAFGAVLNDPVKNAPLR